MVLFSHWVVRKTDRNVLSSCSLISQERSWQILEMFFQLSYWHSSVMLSGNHVMLLLLWTEIHWSYKNGVFFFSL